MTAIAYGAEVDIYSRGRKLYSLTGSSGHDSDNDSEGSELEEDEEGEEEEEGSVSRRGFSKKLNGLTFLKENAGVGSGGRINKLYAIGKSVLMGINDDNEMIIWNLKERAEFARFPFASANFSIVGVCHPPTYINKVLLGSRQGGMKLFNFRSGKVVYDFPTFGCSIGVIEATPALDVVAVGLADGRVVFYNVRYDQTVLSIDSALVGSDDSALTNGRLEPSAIAFRTDGPPVMAVGTSEGSIAVWHLGEVEDANRQKEDDEDEEDTGIDQLTLSGTKVSRPRLLSLKTDAHRQGPVTLLRFLPKQPVMISCGSDNSVKMWIMDGPAGEARLLRQRKGPSQPPSHLLHYDSLGHNFLAAGLDRSVRLFSCIRDEQSVELSQGKVESRSKKKGIDPEDILLPSVTAMAAHNLREREWDTMVTCHLREAGARTWSVKSKRLGKHVLLPPATSKAIPKQDTAVCCTISHCGNFAFIGRQSGAIDCYNMQSGLHRGRLVGIYDAKSGTIAVESTTDTDSSHRLCHKGPVKGIATDLTNSLVFSWGFDGHIRAWKFYDQTLVWDVVVGRSEKSKRSELTAHNSPISSGDLHRESLILAVVIERTNEVIVYDLERQNIVRRFDIGQRVTCLKITPDSSWLMASTITGLTFVFELSTATLVDLFRTSSPITSLSVSPSLSQMLTSHADFNGVCMWTNRTMYDSVVLKPLTTQQRTNPPMVHIMALDDELAMDSGTERDDEDWEDMDEEMDEGEYEELKAKQAEEAGDMGVVSLSGRAANIWQALLHIDDLKARNEGAKDIKVNASAPFFLPTTQDLNTRLDPTQDMGSAAKELMGNGNAPSAGSRVRKRARGGVASAFSDFVREAAEESTKEAAVILLERMKGMSNAELDLELRMLPSGPDGSDAISNMLKCLGMMLDNLNSDFELIETYLAVTLKHHADIIIEEPKCAPILRDIAEAHSAKWTRLRDHIQYNLCMVNFLRRKL
eukprot:Clim_evm127s147 gene=Clim_evmTU127s147